MQKSKFHKYLSKKCPECGGKLQKIEYFKGQSGRYFSAVFIECTNDDCDYSEELKVRQEFEDDYSNRKR